MSSNKLNLKKYFPISYENSLLKAIISYLIVGLVAGLLIWVATKLTGWIPVVGVVIGWLVGIVSVLVEVYIVCGIVVSILRAIKFIK